MDIDWYRLEKYYEFSTGVEELYPELVENDPDIRFVIMQIKAYNTALRGYLEKLDNEVENEE